MNKKVPEVPKKKRPRLKKTKPIKASELDEFFDFVSSVISDSPHAGDDQTYDWAMMLLERIRQTYKDTHGQRNQSRI